MNIYPISASDAKPWILQKHYAHRMPCVQYAYGLYNNKQLCGIVTYGQPASPFLCIGVCGKQYKKKILELNRLCIDCDNKNAASFLIGQTLQKLPTGIVVSYADTQYNHIGYVYQATNWLYTGCTKARTDIYSEQGHSRHHCGDTTKRQNRSAKHRYIFFCGNRRERKQMYKDLRYDIKPYPKGNTIKYNAGKKIATQMLLF